MHFRDGHQSASRDGHHWPCAGTLGPWLHEVKLLGELDGGGVREREAAFRRCMVVARLCDEVWLVGGRRTEEMRRIAISARKVSDLLALGPEPPEVEA